MKKHIGSFALLACLMAVLFTACVKETPEPKPTARLGWWIGIAKVFQDCRDGSFICIRPDRTPYPDMLNVKPNTDEVAALPLAQKDGSILVTAQMNGNNLSQRAQSLLLDRRLLELGGDIVLGEELLRTAYENAGLPYQGQQIVVPKGAYAVKVEEVSGNGTANREIKITITIGKVTVIITIRF